MGKSTAHVRGGRTVANGKAPCAVLKKKMDEQKKRAERAEKRAEEAEAKVGEAEKRVVEAEKKEKEQKEKDEELLSEIAALKTRLRGLVPQSWL